MTPREPLIKSHQCSAIRFGSKPCLNLNLGSATSIKIAQKWIPEALSVLNDYEKDAIILDNNGIKNFANQTQQLFEMIGPGDAKFVEQKVEIQEKLSKLYDEQDKMFRILADKQGDFILIVIYN